MSRVLPNHTGGCHCGVVKFDFSAPKNVTVQNWEDNAASLAHLA